MMTVMAASCVCTDIRLSLSGLTVSTFPTVSLIDLEGFITESRDSQADTLRSLI
jgi:hypothetical protein